MFAWLRAPGLSHSKEIKCILSKGHKHFKEAFTLIFWLIFYHSKHDCMVTTCSEALRRLQVVSQQASTTRFKELNFHHQKLHIKLKRHHLVTSSVQCHGVRKSQDRSWNPALHFSANISNYSGNLSHFLSISIPKLERKQQLWLPSCSEHFFN